MIFIAAIVLTFLFAVVFLVWMDSRKSKCTRGGNQHKFEPRYSEESISEYPPVKMSGWGFSTENVVDIIEAQKSHKTTYVHDVCVWCGKTIESKQS